MMMIFPENVFLVMIFVLVVVFIMAGSCLVLEGYKLCEDCYSCSGLGMILVAISFVVVAKIMKLMNYSVVSVFWLLMQKQMKPVLLQREIVVMI